MYKNICFFLILLLFWFINLAFFPYDYGYYFSLNRSSITPSLSTINILWIIVYILLSYHAYKTIIDKENIHNYIFSYLLSYIFIQIFPIFFFYFRISFLSLINIILILLTSFYHYYESNKLNRVNIKLLIPSLFIISYLTINFIIIIIINY